MSIKRTVDLKADSPELRDVIQDSELSGCPFCGEALGVNHRLRMIVHPIPECAPFGAFTSRFRSFEEATAALEAKAVFA